MKFLGKLNLALFFLTIFLSRLVIQATCLKINSLVIYWDLRGLYFYNTWNWFHSPAIIPLNRTYGTSAYIFKTIFVLFYKHAYILVKHAATEFSHFYV